MLNSVDFSGKPFHFIGIGGIGMSALAHVLLERGLPISGSDLRLTHITERLQTMGAQVFLEQEASNLEYFKSRHLVGANGVSVGANSVSVGANSVSVGDNGVSVGAPSDGTNRDGMNHAAAGLPQVVCSTAINADNPEYKRALELGCTILHRSDLLAGLIQQYRSISVAGTHGKTTTSSMIGHVLLFGGLDPTVIVGGEVQSWAGNARAGKSDYLVAEADESDGSLVKFQSYIGILTNVELDHPDHYKDLDEVVQTFQEFTRRCQTVIGSIDCAVVKEHFNPAISYSLDRATGADYSVDNIEFGGSGTTAQVWERGTLLGPIRLQQLGQHNLSNALAAVAVGRLLGLSFEAIAAAFLTFGGAKRRFELRGEVNNIRFIDDYAHHPSEVQVTLAAARLQAKAENRRLVAVFQPHRFSRIMTFLPEFAQSFGDADVVVVSDIYSAGEANPGNLDGQQVTDRIAEHHQDVHYQPTLQLVQKFLEQTLKSGDLAIFLSAGNLNQVIPDLIAAQALTSA
jgi:UDP-N-acetylmuramate--alanine ligase